MLEFIVVVVDVVIIITAATTTNFIIIMIIMDLLAGIKIMDRVHWAVPIGFIHGRDRAFTMVDCMGV